MAGARRRRRGDQRGRVRARGCCGRASRRAPATWAALPPCTRRAVAAGRDYPMRFWAQLAPRRARAVRGRVRARACRRTACCSSSPARAAASWPGTSRPTTSAASSGVTTSRAGASALDDEEGRADRGHLAADRPRPGGARSVATTLVEVIYRIFEGRTRLHERRPPPATSFGWWPLSSPTDPDALTLPRRLQQQPRTSACAYSDAGFLWATVPSAELRAPATSRTCTAKARARSGAVRPTRARAGTRGAVGRGARSRTRSARSRATPTGRCGAATGGPTPPARRRARRSRGLPRRLSRRRGCGLGARPARAGRAARAAARLRAAGLDALRELPAPARVRRAAEPLDGARRDRPRRLAARAVGRARRPARGARDRRGRAGHARAAVGQPRPAVHRRRAARADGRAALERGLERARRAPARVAGRARVLDAGPLRQGRRDPRRRRTARPGSWPGSPVAPSCCRRNASPRRSRARSRRPRSETARTRTGRRRCTKASCTAPARSASSGATARPASSPRWRPSPREQELDELLLAGGELTWAAGPLRKGAGLCHGTAGNGFALLKLFTRTGDERWLERARAFATHAAAQVEAAAARARPRPPHALDRRPRHRALPRGVPHR